MPDMRMAVLMTVNSPWAKETVLRLCNFGHEVHVLNIVQISKINGYLDNHSTLRQSNIESLNRRAHIHDISFSVNSNLHYLISGFALKSFFLKHNIEILLSLYGGGYATMAYASGFRPYVIYAVGSDVLLAKGIKKSILRFTYRAAHAIFANGVYLGAKTREMANRDDVESLYLGIDTERFSWKAEDRSRVVILCTRGFLPVYNNEYLIHALSLLPKDTPYTEVVFSSTGPDLDTTKSLADRILPLSIRQKIHFLGGVSDEELLYHLNRASIFVSLSRSDGTSISLLEALSCELFPVISDIPQNREWVDPKLMNGLLVPLDQPKALAEAMHRAIINKELRESAGPINRRLILERADGRMNMEILSAKMEEIVEKHRSKSA
jgi:L-malate glycosyltransferase